MLRELAICLPASNLFFLICSKTIVLDPTNKNLLPSGTKFILVSKGKKVMVKDVISPPALVLFLPVSYGPVSQLSNFHRMASLELCNYRMTDFSSFQSCSCCHQQGLQPAVSLSTASEGYEVECPGETSPCEQVLSSLFRCLCGNI